MTDLPRPARDDRAWEPHLLTLLVLAFGFAASATVGVGPSTRPSLPDPTAPSTAPPPAVPEAAQAITAVVDARGEPLVPLRVADVVLADGEATGVVLLADAETRVVLPVWMTAAEGESVRRGLQETPPPALMQLVLGRTITGLGAEVVRVEMTARNALDDVGFGGRVVLKRNGTELSLEATAGEALALALSAGKQIFVTGRLVDAQGILRDAVKHRPGGLPSGLKAPERL